MKWIPEYLRKLEQMKNPLLLEGLPGFGNVGKFAVDFLIDELKAKRVLRFRSYFYPNTVFVNEHNLVELPSIEIYHAAPSGSRSRDILLLAGDVQPVSEESCYDFSDTVLDLFQSIGGTELITLGGIARRQIPKKPLLFCTGTDHKTVASYCDGTSINKKLYGVVGPIIGVSGLLLGLARKRKMHAVGILAETYMHPMYLGVRGAREIIKTLNKKLNLSMDLQRLDNEIDEFERKRRQAEQMNLARQRVRKGGDMNYIG